MQRVLASLRAATVSALVVVGLIGSPPVARAHTDLEYTLPADGEQAAGPVSEITVAFDAPVTLVGAGFEVLTPAGTIVEPAVSSGDGAVYVLEVAEPLSGGTAAVRYQVSAADGHVLEGGFSFTVPALPVATTAPSAPTPTATPAPPTSAATGPPVTTPAPITPATSTPATTPAPRLTAPAPTAVVVAAADDSGDDAGSGIGILLGVVAAVVVAGAAILLLRSRTTRPD